MDKFEEFLEYMEKVEQDLLEGDFLQKSLVTKVKIAMATSYKMGMEEVAEMLM